MTQTAWVAYRLGDALEVLIDHRGKTPGKLGGVFTDSGVPVISAIHVKHGSIDFSRRARFVTHEMFTRWMPEPLRAGDVLMTSEAPMGSVAMVTSNSPLVLSQRLFAMRGREGLLDNRFLRWALVAEPVRQQLKARSSGTTVEGIRQSELRQVSIRLPSVAEQRRIVGILENHLSRLDAASAYTRVARRRAESMIKSVLLNAIPDAANYPINWRTSSVAEAGRVELGRQRHPDWHNGPNMHPYLRVANVFEDRIDSADLMEMHWPDATFERFKLFPGDVLLNEGQTPELLGRPALYRGEPADVAFTNSLLRFKANDDVLPEFALLVFRRHMHAGRFTRESRITTNIAHLSASRLKPIEFPIPPLDEQASLVNEVAGRLGAVKRLEEQVAALQVRAGVFRRALLAAAFEGKLTGRRADQEVIEELAGV